MALSSVDQKISNLLNNCVFVVPGNQRKYVWKETNWKELLEDIDLVYEEKRTDHFVGSVVLKTIDQKDGIREHFSIIDGQQRVLTITLLIASIGYLYALSGNFNKLNGLKVALLVMDRDGVSHPIVSDRANYTVAKIVENLFEIAQKVQDDKTKIPSITVFLEEIKNRDTAITKCMSFFVSEMKKRMDGTLEILDKYEEIIEGIRYINVNADTDEDAYAIFEVLNARGQELLDFDLLRNFLLKYSTKESENNILEKIIDIEDELGDKTEVFLKHYVLHRYGLKTDKREKRPYKVIASKEKGNNIDTFINDLNLKATYYKKIIKCQNCSELEEKIFRFFISHRQQQFRPLLLGLMHQKELNNITDEVYQNNILYLYRFFICYNVIGDQTSNKIDDIVEKYSEKIENAYSQTLFNQMRISLVKRLPSESQFKNCFKSIAYSKKWEAFSGSKKRGNALAILEYYEDLLGNKMPIDNNYNIEHCLPDSKSPDNSFIGNLMLLEKGLNDKCGDKKLVDKKEYYKQSKLKEPHNIARIIENDEFSIEKRFENMSSTIYASISEMADLST